VLGPVAVGAWRGRRGSALRAGCPGGYWLRLPEFSANRGPALSAPDMRGGFVRWLPRGGVLFSGEGGECGGFVRRGCEAWEIACLLIQNPLPKKKESGARCCGITEGGAESEHRQFCRPDRDSS
jgi:hypothetical protein